MILALLLFLMGGFRFEGVVAWKYSEGRQEQIPALHAILHNETGEDWKQARFRVTVRCNAGGERSYVVRLSNLPRGTHQIAQTAFDDIGKLEACEGTPAVEFIDGVPVPLQERTSYVILGFSFSAGDGPPSLDLEGILDHRTDQAGRSSTTPVWLGSGGERLRQLDGPGVAYYAFPVQPGTLGLAGFLRNRDPLSGWPSRFLRVVEVPYDSAVFIGTFRTEQTPAGLVSVILDPDDKGWQELREAQPLYQRRTLRRAQLIRPSNSGAVARE